MKNVLLWIASIFSMLLDAVKKSKLDIVTIQVPRYEMRDVSITVELKGEKKMIIITSSIKDVKAYKKVSEYAQENGLTIVGSYIVGKKRNFVLTQLDI